METNCAECGRDCFDQYMVYDTVWLSVMPSRRGFLHAACLKKRLGRPLTLSDLTMAPINNMVRVWLGAEPTPVAVGKRSSREEVVEYLKDDVALVEWLKTRPAPIQELAKRYPATALYRMKEGAPYRLTGPGCLVVIRGYTEDGLLIIAVVRGGAAVTAKVQPEHTEQIDIDEVWPTA